MTFQDLQALLQADDSDMAQRAALKRRAITLLARREHSRAELMRKLQTPPRTRGRRARRGSGQVTDDLSPDDEARLDGDFGEPALQDEPSRMPARELIESVLDELESLKLLSDRRMAESFVRNGAERFGRARLSQNLQRKGLDESLIAQVLQPLADDEKNRAEALWQRRFGQPPVSLNERARQYRFLLGRGFSPAIVSAVVPRTVSAPDEEDEAGLDDLP